MTPWSGLPLPRPQWPSPFAVPKFARRQFLKVGDFTVYDDGRPVGRIYQKHAPASPDLTWFWSITEYVEPRSGLRTSGMAETLDAAKAAFRDCHDKWRAWAARTGFDPT